MASLSEHERIEILMMLGYGDRRRSLQDVCNLFNDTHPNRNPISKSVVGKTLRRFEQTGSVKDLPRSGRPRTAKSDDNKLDILLAVSEDPHLSTNQLAANFNISQSSIVSFLKSEKYKPYKVHLVHELTEDDFDRRLQFSEEMLNICNNNENFVNNILFSDEATFCLTGEVNRHNCRYWSSENPSWFLEHHTQYPQKVNVWVGILGGHIIGPFFINGNLTSGLYLQLLQNEIIPACATLYPHENNEHLPNDSIWFQQDGAPPHYGVNVRQYLDNVFPHRWIGRRGTIEWPARSPDLSPLDFFLWGYVKNKVYEDKPDNVEDLQIRITRTIQEIPRDFLQNSVRGFVNRLGHCQITNGRQFEHLL